MKFFYFIVLTIFFAKSPLEVTLGMQVGATVQQEKQSLLQYDKKEVTIRGFLFQRQGDGRWILSSMPPVPSCCAHKQSAEAIQIVLDEKFTSKSDQNSVTAVKGIFNVDVEKDKEGKSQAQYFLREAVEIQKNPPDASELNWIEAFAVAAILLLSAMWLWKRRQS